MHPTPPPSSHLPAAIARIVAPNIVGSQPVRTSASRNHRATAPVLAGQTRAESTVPIPRPVTPIGHEIRAIEPAVPGAVLPEPAWTLEFDNAPVREVLTTLARGSRREIVLTGGVSGNVSVQLRGRATDDAVRLVAAAAGLQSLEVGGTWMVGPAAELRKVAEQVGETTVLNLSRVAAKETAAWLSTRLPLLRADAVGEKLVLTGLPADIAAATKMVQTLDGHGNESLSGQAMVPVGDSDPKALASAMAERYPSVEFATDGAMLRLRGPADAVESAARATASWGVEQGKRPAQAVIELRYLHAERAAEALRKAIPDIVATVAPEQTAPPSARFAPLGGGFASGNAAGGNPSGASGNNSAGAGGRGASEQPVSRSTRLILIGPHHAVESARRMLAATDVPAPMAKIEASVYEVEESGLEETGVSSVVSGEIGFVIPGGKGIDLSGSDIQRTAISVNNTLRGLVVRNRAKLLAQPSLSVVDNEDASIFIGDLVRFRGSTFTPGTGGVVQGVETIPVGIALLLRPRIHPDGDITLKVHPVVGSLVEDDGNGLPRTSSREADTTVRLRPKEELVIGGLDRQDRRTSWRRVPLLGDLPLVGPLFRGKTERMQKTRIVVVLQATALETAATANPEPAR